MPTIAEEESHNDFREDLEDPVSSILSDLSYANKPIISIRYALENPQMDIQARIALFTVTFGLINEIISDEIHFMKTDDGDVYADFDNFIILITEQDVDDVYYYGDNPSCFFDQSHNLFPN